MSCINGHKKQSLNPSTRDWSIVSVIKKSVGLEDVNVGNNTTPNCNGLTGKG